MGNKKVGIILFLIIILSSFFQFYRLEENLAFNAEIGHNYLEIKNAIVNKTVPLLGPPTSHPWLYFGPLFYWIIAVIFLLTNFNPIAPAYLFAVLGVVTVLMSYILAKEIFGRKVALIASFLTGISPIFIEFFQANRFYTITILLSFIYFLFLYKTLQNKSKSFFPLGLILGIMFNFHLSPVFLLPIVILLIILLKIKVSIKQIGQFIIGLIIPCMPFLIYAMTHKMEMLMKLLIWFPYRIAGFAGIYPKNNISISSLQKTLENVYTFIRWNFFPQNSALTTILIVILIIYIGVQLIESFKNYRNSNLNSAKDLGLFTISVHLLFGLIVFLIHQDPPIHYFLPLSPIPIIFMAILINQSIKNLQKYLQKIGIVIVWVLLLIPIISNFTFFFSKNWYYQTSSYEKLQRVVKTIINDANGKEFNLTRVGPFDIYEGNYAQNYRYLLWQYGNEPVDKPVSLSYTIFETDFPENIDLPGRKILRADNLLILRIASNSANNP